MPLTVFTLLVGLALLITIVSFFDNRYPLVNVAVLLIGIALLTSHL